MSNNRSQDAVSAQERGINELDEILKNLELENKHETQLLEKEQQQIFALEKTLKEKEEGIQRMQEALDKSDEDAKALHKQFRQNKENVESLRKHADVLSCHGDTLETKLQQLQEKHEIARNDRAAKFDHYQSIWANYQEKYESSPLAEKWKSCHREAELGLRDLMEQADAVKELKEAIKTVETKLKSAAAISGFMVYICNLKLKRAKTKVSSSKTQQEAELTEKRITDVEKQIAVARENLKKQQEEEREATKLNHMKVNRVHQNELTGAGDAPVSTTRFPEKQIHPEVAKPSRRFQIPQLIIPQSPRLQNQSGPPRDVPPQTPPPPGMFLEVPQRLNTATALPPKNPPMTSKKYPTPGKDCPQNDRRLDVIPENGGEESSASPPDQRQDEGRDKESDEAVPMETDSDQNQGCDMESSSSQPATPGGSCQGHSKSDCTAAMDEELSASQVREKIRNLPQSPGFQFACRPMYSEQDTESFLSTPPASKGAPNASEAVFLSSFFGQAGSSSAETSANGSVLNMFGSPVVPESSEENIMSLFGPSSPREPSDPASQGGTSGFSFNFAPSSSSPTSGVERSSFSLF